MSKDKHKDQEPEITPVSDEVVTEQSVAEMTLQISELEKKAEEYLDGWQRSRAEFANYKKRVEREQTQMYQVAAGNVLKKFLEVADDLDRALKNRPMDGNGAEWAEGVDLIYRKLVSLMEAEGIKPMEIEEAVFDPNLHEAITHEKMEGYSEGQIIEVVKKGYLLGDRVLRPAAVRVAS